MKILRLDLMAYGPFTGASLEFPEGSANLHIIYGPNEAGKSCALRALSNVLYGIPTDSGDSFLHPYEDLRIGLTLGCTNGPVGVIRRKGRANSLRRNDAAESVFPAPEWTALLPVGERDLFEQMFAVDHAEVATGGKLLLSSGSDLGGMLFAATGGLERLRDVQAELQRASEELFVKRGKVPAINKAVSDYRSAIAEINKGQLVVGGYKKLRDSLEDAERDAAGLAAAIQEASAEEQRLLRLQQALPFAAKRQRRLEQLGAHTESPTLAADFEDRYQRAVRVQSEAHQELLLQTRDVETLQGKIDATGVELEVLERETEISRLYPLSASVKKGADDRLRREQSLETAKADAMAILREIGVEMPLEAAAGLRIPEPARARIFELSTRKGAVDQEAVASARELQKAREEQARTRAELAGMEAAVDTGALEEAVAMSPAGRDLEAEHSNMLREFAAAGAEMERALAALPGWTSTADVLAGAPVPLAETVAEFQKRFMEQGAEEQRLETERARLRKELDAAEKDLRRIEREQEVPTEADLAASRDGRNERWTEIRTDWLSGINSDGKARAAVFEESMTASDGIADRLRREADRVSKKAGLLVSVQRLEEELAALRDRTLAAERAGAMLQSEWASCWDAAKVVPRTPGEMQSWLRQREGILAKRGELLKAERELEREGGLIQSIRRELRSRLNGSDGTLRELMAEAKRVIAGQKELRQRQVTLQAGLEKSVTAIAGLETRVAEAQRAVVEWTAAWRESTEKLPVRRDASPAEVQVVMDRIGALMVKLEEAAGLADRIEKLKRDEDEFRRQVAALGRPAESPFAAIAQWNSDLQKNRTNRDVLKELAEQVAAKQTEMVRSQQSLERGSMELAELCREAGVADADVLPSCVENAKEKHRLRSELRDVEESLSGFAGGQSIAQLVAEIEALRVDELPNRIAELRERLVSLKEQKAERDQALGALRQELKQQEEAGTAVRAAEDAQQLRSRIVNLSSEYVRLRMASRILANAVERYREKNQGPLLKSAAGIFQRMTDGSFTDLRVDWNEKSEAVLMGVRANGKTVGIEGLSEGTRDQLFLALRLAYVLNYCDSHGPAPFIGDDVLMTFDNDRAKAGLRALEMVSQRTQVLLFTHHSHLLELANEALPATAFRVHYLASAL